MGFPYSRRPRSSSGFGRIASRTRGTNGAGLEMFAYGRDPRFLRVPRRFRCTPGGRRAVDRGGGRGTVGRAAEAQRGVSGERGSPPAGGCGAAAARRHPCRPGARSAWRRWPMWCDGRCMRRAPWASTCVATGRAATLCRRGRRGPGKGSRPTLHGRGSRIIRSSADWKTIGYGFAAGLNPSRLAMPAAERCKYSSGSHALLVVWYLLRM